MLEPKKHYYLGVSYHQAPLTLQDQMPRHEDSVIRLLRAGRKFIKEENCELLIASLNQRIDFHLFAPFESPCYHRLVELLRRHHPVLFDPHCARSHATGIYAMRQLLVSACEEHQQHILRSLGLKKSISLSIAQNFYGPWLNQAWIHVMRAIKSTQSAGPALESERIIESNLSLWKTWQRANNLTEMLVMPDSELVELSHPPFGEPAPEPPLKPSEQRIRRWTWQPCQMLRDSSATKTRPPLPLKSTAALAS